MPKRRLLSSDNRTSLTGRVNEEQTNQHGAATSIDRPGKQARANNLNNDDNDNPDTHTTWNEFILKQLKALQEQISTVNHNTEVLRRQAQETLRKRTETAEAENLQRIQEYSVDNHQTNKCDPTKYRRTKCPDFAGKLEENFESWENQSRFFLKQFNLYVVSIFFFQKWEH